MEWIHNKHEAILTFVEWTAERRTKNRSAQNGKMNWTSGELPAIRSGRECLWNLILDLLEPGECVQFVYSLHFRLTRFCGRWKIVFINVYCRRYWRNDATVHCTTAQENKTKMHRSHKYIAIALFIAQRYLSIVHWFSLAQSLLSTTIPFICSYFLFSYLQWYDECCDSNVCLFRLSVAIQTVCRVRFYYRQCQQFNESTNE